VLAKLRPRLSYANVIATIALFVALGGGAYAATQLPKNSVGAKQLRKGAVNSAKVKDASLMSKDFKAGQLPAGPTGARGAEGPRGLEGARGATGQTGARGPSNAYVDSTAGQITISSAPGTLAATLAVPAGTWAVFGRVNVFNNGILATGECSVSAGATTLDTGLFKLQTSSGANELPLTLHGIATFTGPTAIQMFCEEESAAGADFRVSERRLTAIQVETLTQQ
jgi:hypothetical protein